MPRICLVIIAACLLLAGCNRAHQQASAAAPFPMPYKWPLAQICVPEDSRPASLPGAFPSDEGNPYQASGLAFNERSENSGKMWSVAFTSEISWEQQLAGFALQHEPLGYQLNWDKPLTREYISADGRYITQLHLDVESGVSVLSVFAYDGSWPGTSPLDS
ncbi:MAG: hypothetical protein R3F46_02115 [bacterium]